MAVDDASAGRLYVDVVGDTTGFAAGLQQRIDEQVRQVKARIRAEIDTSQVRRDVEAAARAARGRAVIQVGVDRDHLRRTLASAVVEAAGRVRGATVQVGVDVDTARMAADVRTATAAAGAGGGGIDVPVGADTARMAAEIEAARLAEQRKGVEIPVRISKSSITIANQIAGMGIGFGMLVGKAALFEGIGSAIVGVGGALAGLVGGLYAVGAASTAAVGALALIPNLASAGVQSLGSIVAGFAGIGDAVGAMTQLEDAAATGTLAAAAQRENAALQAQQIARSQEAAVRAQEQAARGVVSAERGVRNAQEASRRAQEDLNRAREDAAEGLEDLQFQLRGAALDEEDASIALERAKERLAETQANPFADPLDRREAVNDYRQAALRLDEVREANEDLRQSSGKQIAEGVDGNAQVLAAQIAVRDSVEAESDARFGLVEAHRAVADAQRQAADAQQAAVRAQRDNAIAAAGGAAGVDKLAAAMANLSPAGRSFVQFLANEALPALKDTRKEIQEALLPGVERGARRLVDDLLPDLERIAVRTAGGAGAFFERLADSLARPEFRRRLNIIGEGNIRALERGGNAALLLLDGISRIMVIVAQEGGILDRFTIWVEDIAGGFEKSSRDTQKWTAFLEKAGDVIAQWGRILGNISGGLFNIGKAGEGVGQSLLDSFEGATEDFEKWTKDNEDEITAWFEAIEPIVEDVGAIIRDLAAIFIDLADDPNTVALFDRIREDLMPVIDRIVTALSNSDAGDTLVDALVALGDAVAAVIESGALSSFLEAITDMLEAVAEFANSDFGQKVLPWLGNLVGMAAALGLVGGFLLKIGVGFARIATAIGKLSGSKAAGVLKALLGGGERGSIGGGRHRGGAAGAAGAAGGAAGGAAAGGAGAGAAAGGAAAGAAAGRAGRHRRTTPRAPRVRGGKLGLLASLAAYLGIDAVTAGLTPSDTAGTARATGGDIAQGAGLGALEGAALGAAIGSIIPGVGTLIGGALGGGIGAVRGGQSASGKDLGGFLTDIERQLDKGATVVGGKFDEIELVVGTKLNQLDSTVAEKASGVWSGITDFFTGGGGGDAERQVTAALAPIPGVVDGMVRTAGGAAEKSRLWSIFDQGKTRSQAELALSPLPGVVGRAVAAATPAADASRAWAIFDQGKARSRATAALSAVPGAVSNAVQTAAGRAEQSRFWSIFDRGVVSNRTTNAVAAIPGIVGASVNRAEPAARAGFGRVFSILGQAGPTIARAFSTVPTRHAGMVGRVVSQHDQMNGYLARNPAVIQVRAAFGEAYQRISEFISNAGRLLSNVFSFGGGGSTAPASNSVIRGLKFATGGVVPGYAPGHDSIPALVSPGEGWLIPQAVRGIAAVMGTTPSDAIRRLNGQFTDRVDRYADGGVVPGRGVLGVAGVGRGGLEPAGMGRLLDALGEAGTVVSPGAFVFNVTNPRPEPLSETLAARGRGLRAFGLVSAGRHGWG